MNSMKGGGSDAESSGSDARPLFRPLKSGPAAGAGKRAKVHRSVDELLDASALPDQASSDEEQPMARPASLQNLPDEAAGKDGKAAGGALAKLNKRLRKKKDAAALDGDLNPRAKRAKARLERLELDEFLGDGDTNENPSMEDSIAYLEQLEFEGQDADGEGAPKEGGKSKKTKGTMLKRKPATKGGQMKVAMEGSAKKNSPGNKSTPGSGSKGEDEITPAKEARLRIKETKGKGKGKAKDDGDGLGSESEDEDNSEQVKAWEADLATRIDKEHPDVLATAFSIKPCPVSAIRQLPVASFLGRRRLEEGGHLLMDTGGFVNVHFMLGTYRNLQKLHERQKRGDKTAKPTDKADIKYLRWLIVKALKLHVINKREKQQGKVNQARIKMAEKSLRWSLSRKSNLAEFSDNEGADEVSPELKFKGKEKAEDAKAVAKEGRQNLRTAIVKKQSQVSASSSHNIDMEDMQNRLTAPSLSFDWEEKGSDEEEGAMLEVDMPEEEAKSSRRNMFKDQLQRSASFHMAKGLTHRGRTKFNLNKAFSQEKLPGSAPALAPPELERTISAPARMQTPASAVSSPVASVAKGSSEKGVESKLWDVLANEPGASEKSADVPQTATSEVSKTPAMSSKVDQSKATEKAPTETDEHEPNSLDKFLSQDLDKRPAVDSAPSTLKSGSGSGSTKQPSDVPASQDWHGITPTAMWNTEMDSRESFDSILGAEDKPATKALEELSHDISPTMPFVPSKADEHADISPTMPFVAKATEQSLEISPTMPFAPTKPADDQVGCSPTQAFVSKEPKARVEISPTAPYVPTFPQKTADSPKAQVEATLMPEAAPLSVNPNPVNRSSSNVGKAEEKQPAQAGKRLKRSTSLISEDSLSESPSADEDEEEQNEQTAKRRKREREWLRHNRKAARQTAKDAMASKKRKKVDSNELGVSLLSTQERSRYQDVVDTVQVSVKASQGSSQAAPMLRGSDGMDEAEVFGGFDRAPGGSIKKKSFLMK